MRNLRVDARFERSERQRQADEVEVFELFGGGLPVIHHIVTVRTKGMGDRSAKPFRLMTLLRRTYFMSVTGVRENRGVRRRWTFMSDILGLSYVICDEFITE